ncbi:hypothetical protein QS713_00875 [Gleimia hominis]|uniref:YbjN domain-containing protein n=1 Tax=Gleimia hominis TaxID=595468 RepID=A0ABU3I8C0_9ACTO|nr:hypothetical protein [Gleimia hominis]MDT3766624.1 hypothetical protein [Gleimia hominis]
MVNKPHLNLHQLQEFLNSSVIDLPFKPHEDGFVFETSDAVITIRIAAPSVLQIRGRWRGIAQDFTSFEALAQQVRNCNRMHPIPKAYLEHVDHYQYQLCAEANSLITDGSTGTHIIHTLERNMPLMVAFFANVSRELGNKLEDPTANAGTGTHAPTVTTFGTDTPSGKWNETHPSGGEVNQVLGQTGPLQRGTVGTEPGGAETIGTEPDASVMNAGIGEVSMGARIYPVPNLRVEQSNPRTRDRVEQSNPRTRDRVEQRNSHAQGRTNPQVVTEQTRTPVTLARISHAAEDLGGLFTLIGPNIGCVELNGSSFAISLCPATNFMSMRLVWHTQLAPAEKYEPAIFTSADAWNRKEFFPTVYTCPNENGVKVVANYVADVGANMTNSQLQTHLVVGMSQTYEAIDFVRNTVWWVFKKDRAQSHGWMGSCEIEGPEHGCC